MKLNFSMLKNENIGFRFKKDNNLYSFCGKLLNVRQMKDHFEFLYENCHMDIPTSDFMRLKFEKEENRYYFVLDDSNITNGLVGFTMFDTYGFPVELTEEIMLEKGMVLDVQGFELIRDLSRKKSQENSKRVSAF